MTRDYKHRRRRSKKSSGSGGPFAKGLGLGLAVALLVHLYHMGQDRKADKEAPPPKRSAVTAPDVAADSGPEYDFYEILPEFEVVIPGQIGQPAPSADKPGVTEGRAYYLQAGSFRSFEDADRRKASLALLGIVSEIRRAEVKGRATHRVIIGPVRDPGRLQGLQRQLVENGIEYLALQAKEPSP